MASAGFQTPLRDAVGDATIVRYGLEQIDFRTSLARQSCQMAVRSAVTLCDKRPNTHEEKSPSPFELARPSNITPLHMHHTHTLLKVVYQ